VWFVQKLPQKLDSDAIEKDFQKLWQQHVVVSKKVLQLILQKHTTFNEEFSRFEQNHASETKVHIINRTEQMTFVFHFCLLLLGESPG
jgi:hypothetical protein